MAKEVNIFKNVISRILKLYDGTGSFKTPKQPLVQLAGAVEYTNCPSVEG